jgi:predicted ATP-grasp superfamily ATP-dependent carboligase/protein-tyrosine-phosphatase
MSPRSRKVLVLGKDTRAFLSVVRSLGRQRLHVHVGWCDPGAAAARSRYVSALHEIPPPAPGHLAWRDRLLEMLEREHFDLVIPCNDPSILPLQLHRQQFAPFVDSIYLLDELAFRIAFDKVESYELARSLGIAVPRRVRVSRLDDLAAALSSFSLPMVVKPRASFTADRLTSKHHVRLARSPEELALLVQALLPWGDVAVEEKIGGHGAGVEVLAHEGEVLASFQHVRVHEPPTGGGSSYRRSAALDGELFLASQKFLEALRYTGVAMLEFKVDPERGTWAFIEINARFWGSLPLALAAGVDFPYYLYQMWVEGRRDFPREYRTGVYCRNLVNDVLWMKKAWRAGSVSRWRLTGELARLATLREHSDTFVADDPWPGLAELWSGVRRGVRAAGRKVPRPRRRRANDARRALQAARRVLFVCKGNICRSPFAHRLAERVFPSDVRVASCGYHPAAGRSCPIEAVRVAEEMGIDLRSHRSLVLSAAMLRDADVVLVFDDDNYRMLRDRHAWAMPKVHFLGVVGGHPGAVIRDPDGGGLADFRLAYETIRRSVMSAFAPTPRDAMRSPRSIVRRITSTIGRRLRWHPLSVAMRLLMHALRNGLWRSLSPALRKVVREQQVLTWPTLISDRSDSADIVAYLRQCGLRVQEGGNAFYLPPQPRLVEMLGAAVEHYPPGSGFKILRDFRGVEEAHYLHPQRQTRLRRRLIGTPRDQLIVANYLHHLHLGPRVWDLCLLRAGRIPMPAFVVQHVEGTAPDADECAAFLQRLRAALSETELRISVPNWERSKDFRSPTCNHNLLRDASGALNYIDFQNFTVRNPQRILEATPEVASPRPPLRRREGSAPEAAERFHAVRHLLGEHGLELRDRLVLDIGCHGGVMLHHALSAGAWWGLGWDRPAAAMRAQAIAVALGFTRLDVIPADLDDQYDFGASVPGWLGPHLEESIVLCLAIGQHIGVASSVVDLPWRALVYEAHDGEPVPEASEHVRAFVTRGARVAHQPHGHTDARARPLFLLIREPAAATVPAHAIHPDPTRRQEPGIRLPR